MLLIRDEANGLALMVGNLPFEGCLYLTAQRTKTA
jgi:hypothetical protein